MTPTVDFATWQARRRAMLARQVEVLDRYEGPRTHRPRSAEDWEAIAAAVKVGLALRKTQGRWRWIGPRRVRIELGVPEL